MSKKIGILALIITISLSLSIMSNTYSRYIADTTSNVDVVFSKWQILVSNTDITNGASSSIDLVPIIEENQNVEANTFAPASKGYFDIDIDPTNVGVSFDYSIGLSVLNEDMPDLMITKYAIIDSDYVEGDELTFTNITDDSIKDSLTYDRTIEEFKFKPFTVRVYFEWYEGIDEEMDDTADTNTANQGNNLSITASISFEQRIN